MPTVTASIAEGRKVEGRKAGIQGGKVEGQESKEEGSSLP
jgi:hypothetical protein